MNSANKVGEIFTAAGNAFNQLAELTMQLHPTTDSNVGTKWTDEEIEMLRQAIIRFSEDINAIAEHIKGKTLSQLRTTLKKKAYEDAGLPTPRQVQPPQQQPNATALLGKPSEVTLNMLNAGESEVDVEGLNEHVKLEFEHATEEVHS